MKTIFLIENNIFGYTLYTVVKITEFGSGFKIIPRLLDFTPKTAQA